MIFVLFNNINYEQLTLLAQKRLYSSIETLV